MKSHRQHHLGRTLVLGCMAIADPGAISQLSNSANATPQARHIAGGQNVSVDGGTDSYAHVTYNDNVKSFDESDVRSSLMGISSDGHGWVFQNAPAGIKALKAGDVFVVKGQLAVKVVGAVTQDDKTLIETGEASLRDLVQSGDVKIDAPVRFHGPKSTPAPSASSTASSHPSTPHSPASRVPAPTPHVPPAPPTPPSRSPRTPAATSSPDGLSPSGPSPPPTARPTLSSSCPRARAASSP
jgi:hypothetical protein